MHLYQSTIIITGASAGIGKAVTTALAQEGANVVVAARRADRLHSLVKSLDGYPGQRLAITGDIGQATFAQSLVSHAVSAFGRVDVLINNAGIGQYTALTHIPQMEFERLWQTNVFGLTWATQAAITQMRRQNVEPHTKRRGQIINISSIVGQRPLVYSAAYTASKAAVNSLSRSLRMELWPEDITVTTVYPGVTTTEFRDARLGEPNQLSYRASDTSPERVARVIGRAIRRQKEEVYITTKDWAFVHANRLFPRLMDRLLSRVKR